jgi:hypothetical protein
MPRLLIPPTQSTGPYPVSMKQLTWTVADDADGNEVHLTGREVIFLRGIGTASIIATPDGNGRIQDIDVTLASDVDPWMIGPIGMIGFRQPDRPVVYIDTDAAMGEQIQIAVVTVY